MNTTWLNCLLCYGMITFVPLLVCLDLNLYSDSGGVYIPCLASVIKIFAFLCASKPVMCSVSS